MLLRRSPSAAFVPNMYVFPGGRVEATDSAHEALELLAGLRSGAAAACMDLPHGDPSATAYYLAAIRETFEETGILIGLRSDGSAPPTAADSTEVDWLRTELLEDRIRFIDVLARLQCRPTGGALRYFAHWITPRGAPIRFDTRFFAARVAAGARPTVDEREMSDARWMMPSKALRAHASGSLPMIRPTIWALQKLARFATAEEALRALATETVVTILPDE